MRTQLRDKTGRLRSCSAEAEHIAQFLHKVFHSENIGPSSSTPITGAVFTQAFGRHSVPDLLVSALLPAMNLSDSELEPDWHKVQLHMIPKVPVVREPKSLINSLKRQCGRLALMTQRSLSSSICARMRACR